jgi:hypothetical protein
MVIGQPKKHCFAFVLFALILFQYYIILLSFSVSHRLLVPHHSTLVQFPSSRVCYTTLIMVHIHHQSFCVCPFKGWKNLFNEKHYNREKMWIPNIHTYTHKTLKHKKAEKNLYRRKAFLMNNNKIIKQKV